MNVLFVTLPGGATSTRCSGPRPRSRAAVTASPFTPARDIGATLAAIGFEQLRSREVPPPAESNRGAALAALVRDPPRLRAWIKALLLDGVPAAVERLARVVDEFRPRVIVADPMAYEAPIVAARAGIRWAALSSSLNPVVPDAMESELIATNAWLAADRDALFARHGLTARFRVCDCLSPDLTVAFTTEALVGAPPGASSSPALPALAGRAATSWISPGIGCAKIARSFIFRSGARSFTSRRSSPRCSRPRAVSPSRW